jgi:hypothetical protein
MIVQYVDGIPEGFAAIREDLESFDIVKYRFSMTVHYDMTISNEQDEDDEYRELALKYGLAQLATGVVKLCDKTINGMKDSVT